MGLTTARTCSGLAATGWRDFLARIAQRYRYWILDLVTQVSLVIRRIHGLPALA
jgi:hypothetical protein